MKKHIVFDISNILYRTFFAQKGEDDITLAGLAHHTALTTLHKYYREFKPHKLIMCFDRSSWRKQYTLSEECISGKPYKGNRRQKMTPAEKAKYAKFMDHLREFEDMMREHTSIITLAADLCEADDLMSGVVQVLTIDPENEVVVVSADKDMIQLLQFPNVRLIDPASGKDRTLDEWGGDAQLFMFEKCLRGDAGDNVQSAYPRLRKTKLLKAWTDEYERANLMNETWTGADGREYIVKQLFQENRLLMDLTEQPDHIQELVIRTVMQNTKNPGTFSYFHFMKFLGKYELKKLAANADTFATMLSR